jgi:hypothetical protein
MSNEYEKIFINVKKPTKAGTGAQTYVGKKKKPTKFLDPYRVVNLLKKVVN